MEKIKKAYQSLLKNGELEELYPWLSGLWSEDKIDFTEIYNNSQEDIMGFDVDYEEYD